MSDAKRVVITGIGALAANGDSAERHWAATLAGRSGIVPIGRFDASGYPTRLGGEIRDFDARGRVPRRLLPQTDRVTQYALAAAEEALEDARVDPARYDRYDLGVITASGCGGFEFGQRELQKLWSEGPQRVSAYQSFAWFYAVNTGQLSIRHGMRGHSSVVVAEQAGGLDALAAARRQVRHGTVRVALAGGLDAPLSPWGLTAQIPNGLLSEADDPHRAYLPFDRRASGYVPGEGGALLVLEPASAARERGAPTVYGEVAGYAATFDPPPHSGRGPNLAPAIRGALRDAGTDPSEIDAVCADAAGLPDRDAEEAAALVEVFGRRAVPVTAPKTLIGRTYAGGGPLDVISALLMMRDGVIPPTANVGEVPDDYGIDLVLGDPRARPVRRVLVVARGHGGFNAALVLTRT
ncbi:ketosynthase chain-length factor [Streptomyces sp. NBC_01239]|uniref:ketosynthase chain-length factor n=1 Tax=Streptomyces sp. NBC_01239 TaxID=2903792 RepID=UPI00224CB615|nr:ketosynthase chain-length factor [Streptomyces sp. NBC_01239]MCX4816347.1 ketosynthase chain-length factor [Streptomyces sp. NBC_01239]